MIKTTIDDEVILQKQNKISVNIELKKSGDTIISIAENDDVYLTHDEINEILWLVLNKHFREDTKLYTGFMVIPQNTGWGRSWRIVPLSRLGICKLP